MKKVASAALAMAIGGLGIATSAQAQTSVLDAVKRKGKLVCPVPTAPYLGFLEVDDKGVWKGLDVEICRSVAAAIFGPGDHAEFSPVSWADRIPALQSGAIDIIVMATGWTRSRDLKLGLQFSQPYFFGGAQFMVPTDLGVKAAKDLNGATVCAAAGTTVERDAGAYLTGLGVKYTMLTFEKTSDVNSAYKNKRCEVLAGFGPGNAVLRATELDPAKHIVLPDVISMEPESIAVKQGSDDMLDIANWTIAALVQADILGITKDNVDSMAADPKASNDVKLLLGVKPGVGDGTSLGDKWAYNVIKASGNYGEIYSRNLGEKSPYKLPPGQNAPWTRGGLLFSPVFD